MNAAPENTTIDGVLIYTEDNMVHQFYFIDNFDYCYKQLCDNWRVMSEGQRRA